MQSKFIKVAVCLVCMAVLAMPSQAQTDNPYQLIGNLGAGGDVSGGGYQMGAALGYAGGGEASGGGYILGGGFFGGGQVTPQ